MHDGRNAGPHADGRTRVLNFSSYDYLGFNGHPEVLETAKTAIDRYALRHPRAARCGRRRCTARSRRRWREHYNADDALVFVSGYATNVSVIGQLCGAKDLDRD